MGTGQVEQGEDGARRWKLAAGVIFGLLAIGVAASGYTGSGKTAGFVVGAATAPLLLGAVVTLVGRAIAMRKRVFEAPGFILSAGALALLFAVIVPTQEERDRRETAEQVVEAFQGGPEACEALDLGDLGGGYAASTLSPGEARAFGIDLDAAREAGGSAAVAAENADVVMIEREQVPQAFAIVIPLDVAVLDEGQSEEEATADMLAGSRDSLTELGASEMEEVTVAGGAGLAFRLEGVGFGVATRSGCHSVQAFGADKEGTLDASERLIAAQTTD